MLPSRAPAPVGTSASNVALRTTQTDVANQRRDTVPPPSARPAPRPRPTILAGGGRSRTALGQDDASRRRVVRHATRARARSITSLTSASTWSLVERRAAGRIHVHMTGVPRIHAATLTTVAVPATTSASQAPTRAVRGLASATAAASAAMHHANATARAAPSGTSPLSATVRANVESRHAPAAPAQANASASTYLVARPTSAAVGGGDDVPGGAACTGEVSRGEGAAARRPGPPIFRRGGRRRRYRRSRGSA